MGEKKKWGQKLDPHSRMQLEDGLPAGGVGVTIRLASKGASARPVEEAGLKLHAQVDDIVVGHVADSDALKQIAELECVQEVQLSRPLYAERPDSAEEET
ncbi:MAG TPA: hypothetical protein VF588_21460 [Pyrinomonadaceae bacterium]